MVPTLSFSYKERENFSRIPWQTFCYISKTRVCWKAAPGCSEHWESEHSIRHVATLGVMGVAVTRTVGRKAAQAAGSDSRCWAAGTSSASRAAFPVSSEPYVLSVCSFGLRGKEHNRIDGNLRVFN